MRGGWTAIEGGGLPTAECMSSFSVAQLLLDDLCLDLEIGEFIP
jgi:hypothetical protein